MKLLLLVLLLLVLVVPPVLLLPRREGHLLHVLLLLAHGPAPAAGRLEGTSCSMSPFAAQCWMR
jgi:hypothetical protein